MVIGVLEERGAGRGWGIEREGVRRRREPNERTRLGSEKPGHIHVLNLNPTQPKAIRELWGDRIIQNQNQEEEEEEKKKKGKGGGEGEEMDENWDKGISMMMEEGKKFGWESLVKLLRWIRWWWIRLERSSWYSVVLVGGYLIIYLYISIYIGRIRLATDNTNWLKERKEKKKKSPFGFVVVTETLVMYLIDGSKKG